MLIYVELCIYVYIDRLFFGLFFFFLWMLVVLFNCACWFLARVPGITTSKQDRTVTPERANRGTTVGGIKWGAPGGCLGDGGWWWVTPDIARWKKSRTTVDGRNPGKRKSVRRPSIFLSKSPTRLKWRLCRSMVAWLLEVFVLSLEQPFCVAWSRRMWRRCACILVSSTSRSRLGRPWHLLVLFLMQQFVWSLEVQVVENLLVARAWSSTKPQSMRKCEWRKWKWRFCSIPWRVFSSLLMMRVSASSSMLPKEHSWYIFHISIVVQHFHLRFCFFHLWFLFCQVSGGVVSFETPTKQTRSDLSFFGLVFFSLHQQK